LNGEVTTGGENPTVIIYWGDNDGTTDPYAWDHSVNLGTKGTVPFLTDITGLTPSTTYYYRCYAANSGGSAWAASSVSFPTLALSAPTVTNSTVASSITVTSARLNGAITNTGGEDPTAIIYWGDNDGATSAYNWDNSVPLGTKAAVAFYTDITDLNISTKYYYRCFASNSVGSAWSDNSSTFTTLAGGVEQKLIGANDAVCSGPAGAGYLCMCRFLPTQSGDMTQFRLKVSAPGNVKVAVYSDSSGSPGTRLNAVNTSTPVVAGWNTITFPSTALTTSSYYWLAFNSETSIVCYNTSAGTLSYKALPFSSDLPASAGTGFTSSGSLGLLAGWAGAVVSSPPGSPTLVTPKTTITFEWSATGGATKYRLQVNTASDFTGTVIFDNAAISTTSQNVALTIGNTYYWRVKAGNNAGWSGWSATGSVTP
jgi:hypothetical protein